MKVFILVNCVYLALISLHNNIRDQLLKKLQENLKSGEYTCLDLDNHYIIHIIKLNRSEVTIERFDKITGFTNSEHIIIQEHLDDDFNLKETIKEKIIQTLYAFEDTRLKYLCILEEDDLYKNEMYLYNFLNSLTSQVKMIENYDESKREYLEYESILRNSYLFSYYTYNKKSEVVEFFSQDYDKELFSLVLIGKGNKLYFFTFDLNSLDMSEYFKYYYVKIRGFLEKDIDILLRFVKNLSFELYEVASHFKMISNTSWNFIDKRRKMKSENFLLTRTLDMEVNEEHMIWNSVCFSPNKNMKSENGLRFNQISKFQLKELKRFTAEIKSFILTEIKIRNRYINLLKGSEVYRMILENILNNPDSGKCLILVNILYSLAIITKSEFDEYLNNRSTTKIYINDIIKQINCHWKSVRFSLYNMLLYSELKNMLNSSKVDLKFVRDFNQILCIPHVKMLMNIYKIDQLTLLEKLHVFIEEASYKPNYDPWKSNLVNSIIIPFFNCTILSKRLIVDERLILLNTIDFLEEDYIQMIYDEFILKSSDN